MMRRLFSALLTSLLAIAIIYDPAPRAAAADVPMNVGLTHFAAIPLDNAVRIEWETDTELGTAGYRLKRGQDGTFAYLAGPGGGNLFISSEGGPTEGSSYSFIDETAVNGQSYAYQLIEVMSDSSEQMVAETTVTVSVTPTSTPISFTGEGGVGGNNNRSAATATATPVAEPSSTPRPSNTPAPAATVSTGGTTRIATVLPAPGNSSPPDNAQSTGPGQQPAPGNSQADDFSPGSEVDVLGAAVVQAQEETPPYPGPDPSASQVPAEPAAVPEQPAAGEPAPAAATPTPEGVQQPAVIGGREDLGGDALTAQAPPNPDAAQDTTGEGSGAGRIYLWVAFIAALAIFLAAVLGAILLYTRQRSAE